MFGSNFGDHITGNAFVNILDGGFGGNAQLTGLGGADNCFSWQQADNYRLQSEQWRFQCRRRRPDRRYRFRSDPAEFSAVVNASTGNELSLPNGNAIELPGVDLHQLILTGNFIHS